ncbi:Lactate/malate dehydrogenase family protein [Salix suchowensis]|nr:Lactate/malate dehydrogenase family protein [Salix suchowensis]
MAVNPWITFGIFLLLFCIVGSYTGVMLGPDQPVILLHLLDIEPAAETLNGVKMELIDAAFPLLKGNMGFHGAIPQSLVELENDAEHVLLARNQVVENDSERNGNRHWLIKSLFESIMKDIGNSGSRDAPSVKRICGTCGNHDEKRNLDNAFQEVMFLLLFHFMRPHYHGERFFSPFLVVSIRKCHEQLEYEAKKLQRFVKEKYFLISGKGVLAESISPDSRRFLRALNPNYPVPTSVYPILGHYSAMMRSA